MRCCNKKLKLPFRKSKLGIRGLSDVGPSTWKTLPNNLKTATNVNCFTQDIKKYFLKKLSETEADIYNINKYFLKKLSETEADIYSYA